MNLFFKLSRLKKTILALTLFCLPVLFFIALTSSETKPMPVISIHQDPNLKIPSTSFSYSLIEGLAHVLISPETEKIGATWTDGKVYDRPLIKLFYDNLLKKEKEEFVVLDIGAQTGSFTLLSKYFPQSRWYAFEPIAEAAEQLAVNLALNGISNTSVFPACVSQKSGTEILKLPQDSHWGLATLGARPLRFKSCKERKVASISIDDFINQEAINRVDFIKIDTEGWEWYVLQGAKETIKKYQPVILMEFNPQNMEQCHLNKGQLLRLLKELNYTWELVSHEDILCTPNTHSH